jgi:NADH-quinone oxidoreductase subunit H
VILALHAAYWQTTLIKFIIVLIAVPTAAAILVQTFLYKTMAHMQSRLGPMEAGPHGSLQLLADAGKFFQKEVLAPERADRRVFILAPVIVMVSAFLVYVVIPIGPGASGEPLDSGIFFALAVSSISVIGVLAAGWSSANKYSLIGGLRAAGQLIAYELPLVLAVVGVVMMAGTMSLQGIVTAQSNFHLFGSSIVVPFVIPQAIGFVLFLIAAQAELIQTPFDMPIAESELVAGYQTEYSGLPFLFFFLGELATAFALAAIASTIFLGGWWVPLYHPTGAWADIFGFGVLFAKTMIVSFLIFWIRFTYPRFREDQLQAFAWKLLIPIALINLLVTAVFKVVVH